MLDEYIEKYGKRLYGLCRSQCQSPDDANDLYQESWLKVHQKLDQYDSEYNYPNLRKPRYFCKECHHTFISRTFFVDSVLYFEL